MAMQISKQGGADGGPHGPCPSAGGMWTCKIKITFQGGDTYATGGVAIGNALRNATGLTRAVQMGFESGGSDVTFAGSGSTFGECKPRLDPVTQKIKMFTLGRSAGSPGPAAVEGAEATNATSIDAMTLVARVWGRM